MLLTKQTSALTMRIPSAPCSIMFTLFPVSTIRPTYHSAFGELFTTRISFQEHIWRNLDGVYALRLHPVERPSALLVSNESTQRTLLITFFIEKPQSSFVVFSFFNFLIFSFEFFFCINTDERIDNTHSCFCET